MPLNAGQSGYGSAPGAGMSGGVGTSETTPLLSPEQEPVYEWHPMTRQELEACASSPGWRRVRIYLVVLFWLTWVAMLAVSVAIVVISPKPVGVSLKWWQKTLFYKLQPDLTMEAQAEGSGGMSAVSQRLPFLRSLGIRALILEGVFHKRTPPSNVTVTAKNMETLAQIQHLLIESSKADLRVVLDLCEVDPLVLQDVARSPEKSNHSAAVQHELRFWLEQGVMGFLICDTDSAYSEETLLEWRGVLEEFSSQEDRIVLVKQTGNVLLPLNDSSDGNVTLVNVVMRSILLHTDHPLSAQDVADAIETQVQAQDEDAWLSWTVGGPASPEMKKLLLVLLMTLPGSPAIYEEIDETLDKEKAALALFTTLSNSKSREESLLFGRFIFLPSNTSSNVSSSTNATVSFPLAFLRSWGCVHFLVLLNFGAQPRSLDPAWAPSLPETGVFVASSAMNRLGSTSLYAIKVQPYEAVVIKLFKAGRYS